MCRKFVVLLLTTLPLMPAYAALPKAKCNEVQVANRPAICWKDVPTYIRYRPSMKECGGNAAAILSGSFNNAFSVVLRDNRNADRLPYCRPGFSYGRCSLSECESGLSRCSAAKVGKKIRLGLSTIYCFNAPGTSPILSKVTRMTIKSSPKVIPGVTFIRVQLKTGRPGAAKLWLN